MSLEHNSRLKTEFLLSELQGLDLNVYGIICTKIYFTTVEKQE